MNILVIGGTGFVGSRVVTRLSGMGHRVTVAHRGETEAELPADVLHIHDPALGHMASDYIAGVVEELRQVEPEVVLHMNPLNDVDAQVVMDAFRGVARRVVGISSGDVYRAYGRLHRIESGPPDTEPYSEDGPLREVMYAEQRIWGGQPWEKILAERVMLGDPELPGTILRWGMVYGPGDPQHRLWENLVHMDAGREVILKEDIAAMWRRPMAFSGNVAAATVLAVTDDRTTGRIYNVAEVEALPVVEFVRELGKAAGWGGEVVVIPRDRAPEHLVAKEDFRHQWVFDTSRIRGELGFAEEVNRQDALRETIEWERANPPGNALSAEELERRWRLEDEALAGLEG